MRDVLLFAFSALVATNLVVMWLVIADALRFRKMAIMMNFEFTLQDKPVMSMDDIRKATDSRFHKYAVAYTAAKREGKIK